MDNNTKKQLFRCIIMIFFIYAKYIEMASYLPPTENLAIFDPSVFRQAGLDGLTYDEASKYFLKYPNAQGTENLQAINVNGISTFNTDANFETNIVMGGTALTNYIQFPDGSKQYSASAGNLLTSNNTWTGTNAFNNANPITSSATMPASTDSSTKIPTTAWVQGAITGSSAITPILSSVGYYPAFNKTIATWQTFNTTTNTQFVDIYSIAGGGLLGAVATNPTLGWSKGIGGCGGGGGMVLNSRVSLGGYSNALAMLVQPQFVCGTTNLAGQATNLNYTAVWQGTFTQSGNNITLVSTTSGTMSVGTIIFYTKTQYDTAYPSATTPYGAYFNQLQIVSGSGTSWVVQSQQTQTLATAITATGYTPEVYWEGTFTQTGNVITAVSTTSGAFNYNTTFPTYFLTTGTANNTQFLTGASGSDVLVNTSMTISTPQAGRILKASIGPNITTRFWSYGAGVNNAYTYFPYIAWCEGGYKGTNGTTNGAQEFGGVGGFGGTAISYLPYGAQISNGAKGQNGGVNDDPSGFTKVSGQGGVSILTNGKTMTINGATTPALYQYNQGSSFNSPSAFAVNTTPASQGGMVVVCYKY